VSAAPCSAVQKMERLDYGRRSSAPSQASAARGGVNLLKRRLFETLFNRACRESLVPESLALGGREILIKSLRLALCIERACAREFLPRVYTLCARELSRCDVTRRN
jgi:hypothetical protein